MRDRRLLFVAYHFPPHPGVGSVRTWAIAKYLSRAGWHVTVLTMPPSAEWHPADVERARAECEQERIALLYAGKPHQGAPGVPKLPMWHPARLYSAASFRMLRCVGLGPSDLWAVSCYWRMRHLPANSFDLVVSSGAPFLPFVSVMLLARARRIPYVLDFRDPWSLNRLARSRQHPLLRLLDRAVSRSAGAITMTSPIHASHQAKTFSLEALPTVIHNGYDPELLSSVRPLRFNDFAVVYAGHFYPGNRSVDPLLRAISHANCRLPHGATPIRLHYYGDQVAYVQQTAKRLGVEEAVVCHGWVKRVDALRAVAGSQVTAIVANTDTSTGSGLHFGFVPGKLFEALGLGTQVLIIADRGDYLREIVERSQAGESFAADQVTEMGDWLLARASSKLTRRHTVPTEYSWLELSDELDMVLQSVCNK